MKLVVDDKIPFLEGVFNPFGTVVFIPGEKISKQDLLDADGLMTRSVTQCNQDLLENTTVRFISSATIGDDHIDKEYCRRNNISWATAKGCNANAVNQYVQAALLNLLNKFGLEPDRLTIGIIGVGNIGSRVNLSAKSLGFNTLLVDPPRQRKEGTKGFSELKEVFEEADIITLHVPLSDKGPDRTHHLVEGVFLDAFKKNIFLINSARGGVVDSLALKKALKNGKVRAAILDVWENEPVPDPALVELALLATPHIAGYSGDGKAKASAMAVQTVSRYFKLGLDDWSPQQADKSEEFHFDGQGVGDIEVLKAVFAYVARLKDTSGLLKNDPSRFSKLRGSYKLRNENHHWSLLLKNCSTGVIEMLRKLGFIVEGIS